LFPDPEIARVVQSFSELTDQGFSDLYEEARDVWRNQAEDLHDRLEKDEDYNVAWHAATTANGDLIRGQVPKTYDPGIEPLSLPGKPSQLIGQRGPGQDQTQVLWLPVTYATSYLARVTYGTSGGPQEQTQTVSTNSVTFNNLPNGNTYTITVTPSNATGPGPVSDPLDVS
jgi:hypothetical protein